MFPCKYEVLSYSQEKLILCWMCPYSFIPILFFSDNNFQSTTNSINFIHFSSHRHLNDIKTKNTLLTMLNKLKFNSRSMETTIENVVFFRMPHNKCRNNRKKK